MKSTCSRCARDVKVGRVRWRCALDLFGCWVGTFWSARWVCTLGVYIFNVCVRFVRWTTTAAHGIEHTPSPTPSRPRRGNGAPSREGCVINGLMAQASNKQVRPPFPHLPPPTALRSAVVAPARSETLLAR